jgi:hypothetical protein
MFRIQFCDLLRKSRGRTIVQATTERGEFLRSNEVSQTKVCNLDVVRVIQKQIFWLQISMDDEVEVTVL